MRAGPVVVGVGAMGATPYAMGTQLTPTAPPPEPGLGHVLLLMHGEAVASGEVDRVHADGLHVKGVVPQWARGTYLELDLFHRSLGLVGAMVAQRTPLGVSLVFASWSPQLFEMIHRLAATPHALRLDPEDFR